MSQHGIVSPDDHLVEPPTLWTDRLPAEYQDIGPRVVRDAGRLIQVEGVSTYVSDPNGSPVDIWLYEDVQVPTAMPAAAVGYDIDEIELRVMTFDEMRPGCYDQKARLEDMEVAGIEASLCFPNMFVRFCGQRFLHGKDKVLALLCVQAYNDYMMDEWCAGSDGKLIPLGIVPLWDVELAKQEIERMAARGMHAYCFSEVPPFLDLPSIHTNYWDPMFDTCQDTDSVLMMHIGSSSKMPMTSFDAPKTVPNTLPAVNSAMSMVDWLFSGVLVRFPELKIGMSETQAGWAPYFLEKCDAVWDRHRNWAGSDKIPQPPSTYFRDRIYLSIFADTVCLQHLDVLGDNLMYESDYPHNDSRWPNCLDVAKKELAHLEPAMQDKILRGNARKLFGLD